MKRGLMILIACAAASSAQAHKLNLFATATQAGIEGKVYFPTGPAAGIAVELRDTAGSVVATAQSAEDGSFLFAGPHQPPITLVSQTADGHRAEFRIDADGATGQIVSEDAPHLDSEEKALRAIVQQELQPLREQLDEQANRMRTRDVLAGIGYILGIFGVIALLKRRPGAPS